MTDDNAIIAELLNKIIECNKENARLEARIRKLEEEKKKIEDLVEDIYEMQKETAEKHEKFLKRLYAMVNRLARHVGVDLSKPPRK